MKVSVIIPFHRGTFFLEDALQSLKEQSFTDFEVLLICDHVEEDMEPIWKEFRDSMDLKAHPLIGKRGVAAARNYGLKLARGEYVYFLDSDDYIAEDTLKLLVANADLAEADLVYGRRLWTWFKRSTFLTNLSKNQEQEDEEEDEADPEDEGENREEDSAGDDEAGEDNDSSEAPEDNEPEEDNNSRGGNTPDVPDKLRQAYWHLISARKGVRNITVLNVLIRRSIIDERQLTFNEDILYLSDYPFLFRLLQCTRNYEYVPEAFYIKRNHNDSVHWPALSQMNGSKSFQEYVDTYLYTVGFLESDEDLRQRLDKKILHYYVRYFAKRLRSSRNPESRNEQFEIMHQLVSGMDKQLLRRQKGHRRRLLKALAEGNINRSISLAKRHHAYRKLKRIAGNRRALAKFLYIHFFLKKSMVENWVFCESFFGKNYSDSPKYIYEYLSEHYPGRYRFIWVIDKKHTKVPYKHTKVKRFSIRYCYYLARCKYYVFNGRQPEWTRKRKGNIFLQTWHGTPLKKLVFDQEDVSSATSRYKKQTYRQSRAWDYLIAPNRYSSDIFRRCFLYDKTMLETGYPRNDILHSDHCGQLADKIKTGLGIPRDKKIILYAPTWRDDEYYSKGRYKFELQLDLRQMKERFGDDYVLLLRTHYFIADSLDVSGLEDFAFNLSKYDDIAELYLISDILITDYSSVFFDYANLRRPMLFFMYDLEKYRDILRGFYIDIEEELPGPILGTSNEVMDAIGRIDQISREYREKYDAFYGKYCAWEDGTSSKKVAEGVFRL